MNRIGVDIGGTFTDLVLQKADGEVLNHKLLTTPESPEEAILSGITTLLTRSGLPASAIDSVIHGTTLVANAIIERKGVATALITTRGMRDVLEIGRELRFDTYDPFIIVPRPLVPRRRRFEVTERVLASGELLTPLDEGEVGAVAAEIELLGIKSVAVCLLHSYKNGAHERRIGELLGQRLPAVAVSLSSEVMPEIREYERTSTTVANAYVKPLVEQYLERLVQGLSSIGIRNRLYLMLSDGGTVDVKVAAEHPIRLVQSGPAGGVYAGQSWGRRNDRNDIICFDMGGTTAKACIIHDGEPSHTTDFEVAREYRFKQGSGLPLKVPVVEMIEIGCGGGSIAGVDGLGMIRVGPESSSAYPGPACYGLGGKDATVTDADLVLGYLAADSFLGGEMTLDRAAAERAISANLAEPLNLNLVQAAWGIHETVNESMASAATVHVLEKGFDAKRFTLFASGGAGPVHAVHVAQKMGLREVICPLGAGVSSAYGFLTAPFAFEFSQSRIERLALLDFEELESQLESMALRASEKLVNAGVPASDVTVEVTARMRYAGQGYEINVNVERCLISTRHSAGLQALFEDRYRTLYGELQDAPVEAVAWRLVARSSQPESPEPTGADAGLLERRQEIKGKRPIYFPTSGGYEESRVYDRYALRDGDEIAGPAVIEERESTVVVPPSCTARVDRSLAVVVTISPPKGD